MREERAANRPARDKSLFLNVLPVIRLNLQTLLLRMIYPYPQWLLSPPSRRLLHRRRPFAVSPSSHGPRWPTTSRSSCGAPMFAPPGPGPDAEITGPSATVKSSRGAPASRLERHCRPLGSRTVRSLLARAAEKTSGTHRIDCGRGVDVERGAAWGGAGEIRAGRAR